LDILGALTQTGIQQTAAGGKARAFCDIVGDQLGTMETNEFLNLGQTLISFTTLPSNLEFVGEIFGVCRLERGKEPFPSGVPVTDLQAFADSAHGRARGETCATRPNSYIV
jgi:hypothetical protein